MRQRADPLFVITLLGEPPHGRSNYLLGQPGRCCPECPPDQPGLLLLSSCRWPTSYISSVGSPRFSRENSPHASAWPSRVVDERLDSRPFFSSCCYPQ